MGLYMENSKTCGENMFIYRVRYAESHGPHENSTGLKKQPLITKKPNFQKIIKMSKNEIFYIGRGVIQDHRGPHKTQKKLEKKRKKEEKGPKIGPPGQLAPPELLRYSE